MKTIVLVISLGALALGLSGCGDKPQSLGGVKNDVAPYNGVENKFAAPGWKAGDRTSWEQALKTRTQNIQNEYTRTATK